MASSTTVPMASTNANIVRILMLKPAADKQANVPTSETIIDTEGINVLLKSCKKKYTTRMTRIIAIIKVSTTLSMDSNKKSLELINFTNLVPLGKSLLILSSKLEISLFTWVAFAPATWNAIKLTPG